MSDAPDMPNNPLTIRPAHRADAALVLQFIRDLAEYERLADEVTATESDIAETLFGDDPVAEVVIAEWSGQPAGFALFFRSYSTFIGRPGLYLEDLFVKPEMRGRGIGIALLRFLAAETQRRGCSRLDWVVLNWNEPAIGFYRRIGARSLDDWMHFRLDGEALAAMASER